MNDMPADWDKQLQSAYPKRSGPMGWGGMRLMMTLRRALIYHTWETILDGTKNYKAYIQASGKEGTEYVQSPQRFLEDCTFLEELQYQAPLSKEEQAKAELKAKEAERWEKARRDGSLFGPPLQPYEHESIGAYETRIRLAQSGMGGQPFAQRHGVNPSPASGTGNSPVAANIADRVSDLTARMKRA